MDYLREQILGSPVVNFDETGIRAGGKLQYLHTASTASTTCLTASSSRGKRGMDEGQVLPRYRGIAVHDCWLSYWKYEGSGPHRASAHRGGGREARTQGQGKGKRLRGAHGAAQGFRLPVLPFL